MISEFLVKLTLQKLHLDQMPLLGFGLVRFFMWWVRVPRFCAIMLAETKTLTLAGKMLLTRDAEHIRRVTRKTTLSSRFGSPEGLRALGMFKEGVIWQQDRDLWHRDRKRYFDKFVNKKTREMLPQLCEQAVHDILSETPLSPNADGVDLHSFMQHVTLRVSLDVFFPGANLERRDRQELIDAVCGFFGAWEHFLLCPNWLAKLRWVPGLPGHAYAKASEHAHAVVEKHLAVSASGADSFQALVMDDDTDLTKHQRVHLMLEMALATIDTTATTLSNAIHGLTNKRELAERIASVGQLSSTSVAQPFKWRLTSEDGVDANVTLIDDVLYESMRLRPVGPVAMRSVPSGVVVSDFTEAVLYLEGLGHDTSVFLNAHEFDPVSNITELRLRGADTPVFPFGEGERSCVGQHFAMTEARCVLHSILRAVDFTLAPGAPTLETVPLEWNVAQQPSQSVAVHVTPRTIDTIVLCGAHSTGKTWLARDLARLTGMPVVDEVARSVMVREGISRDDIMSTSATYSEDTFDALQRMIMREQCKRAHENHSVKGCKFIMDRGIDFLAYTLWKKRTRLAEELREAPEFRELVDILKAPNTLVVRLEPVKEFVRDDNVRWQSDFAEIKQLDLVFQDMFKTLGVSVQELSECTPHDKRAETVLKWCWARETN